MFQNNAQGRDAHYQGKDYVGDRFLVAERLARKGFYLPNGLALQPAQLEQVAETLAGILTAAEPHWNTPA